MNMEGINVSDKKNMKSSGVKEIDVATLLNLCVDIVLKVPELPPHSIEERKTYLEQLSKSPPDKKYWEAGGNCNTTIAATRLGLRCKTIGHVGDEIYGRFLLDVLHDEGVGTVGMSEDNDSNSSYIMPETIVCWVFVDPSQRHDFCSRIDFITEPALSWMSELSSKVKMAINKSKILVCDGYGFGELTPRLMVSAVKYAVKVGTSVFFDPGPQGKILSNGTPEEQRALGDIMKISDVLLLTSEEAESLTGIGNPVLAGLELLRKGVGTKWVVVKMGNRGSILLTMSRMTIAPSFKVNVVDTVGCGDSFTAAIAFGFIHKLPMLQTLTLANAVGAATAMGCGAGRNVATLNQVTELLKAATLNEDDNFWDEILDESEDVLEIEFLSRKVSLQMVVSELLPILDSKRRTG